jgi:hypothetical protein
VNNFHSSYNELKVSQVGKLCPRGKNWSGEFLRDLEYQALEQANLHRTARASGTQNPRGLR